MSPSAKAPTPKQLKMLRRLSMERGQTFVYPKTSGQASAQIRRLLSTKRQSRGEQRILDRQLSFDMAEHRGDDAQVRDDELTGYGSSATWATERWS